MPLGKKLLKFDDYLACCFNLCSFLEVILQLTVIWGCALSIVQSKEVSACQWSVVH